MATLNASPSLDALLRRNGVLYVTVRPGLARSRPARDAKAIRGAQVVKTLLLADERGYALAVIPKNREIDLAALEAEFGRSFRTASPEEAQRIFPGLPLRALPPIHEGRDADIYLEQSLVQLSEVYLETPKPGRLVRLDGESFRSLFYGAWCGQISRVSA